MLALVRSERYRLAIVLNRIAALSDIDPLAIDGDPVKAKLVQKAVNVSLGGSD
jgi:hypothetical protein